MGAKLAGAIPPDVAELVVDDHQVDSTFRIKPVFESDIVKVVESPKGRGESSPGVDGIPLDIIKSHIRSLKSPITHFSFRGRFYGYY